MWIWNNTLTPKYLNEIFGDTGIQNTKFLVAST